jgi:hypothetical protein
MTSIYSIELPLPNLAWLLHRGDAEGISRFNSHQNWEHLGRRFVGSLKPSREYLEFFVR